jgi:glycosyltransferase 2 family protein
MNFRLLINTAISVLILVFLFYQVPLSEITGLFVQSNELYFWGAVLFAALSIWVNALRWKILLKYLGYDYDFKFISNITFITFFFNVYLPGGIAGDVARVAMLPTIGDSDEERKVHLSKITASVVTDKIVGLLGIMLLAFFGICFSYNLLKNSQILTIFILISAGISSVTLLLYSRRIQVLTKAVFALPLKLLSPVKETVKEVIDSLLVFRDNYKVLNIVLPISLLGHIFVVIFFILLAESIGVSIDYLKMSVFIPIIEFVSSLPISLGGLGIREATTIFLFESENISTAKAMGVSLLSFAVILIVGAYGGVLYFLRKSNKKNVKKFT